MLFCLNNIITVKIILFYHLLTYFPASCETKELISVSSKLLRELLTIYNEILDCVLIIAF